MATPTAYEARSLRVLALQLRQSASETDDLGYIEMFLGAAHALEARAARASFGFPHRSRG